MRQLKNEVDIQTVCGHNTFIVKLIAFWQSHREIYLRKLNIYVIRSIDLIGPNCGAKKTKINRLHCFTLIFFFFYLVSEYISGGELFDTIRKFPYKLIQLYVAEIAVALGNSNGIH